MKLSDKVNVYVTTFNSSVGIEFGKRNMLLANVAKSLGLKHWFGDNTFSLTHPCRKGSLVDLPMVEI